MIYLELFLGFLKVGCFSFGGAYAAIPLIRDIVLSYGWLSDEMLTYMIAVSESTPGPIMVNLATYAGTLKAGVFGALVATLAVVLPSFVIILLVTAVMTKFIKNKYVQAALRGIKPCMVGIILATGLWLIYKNSFSAADIKAWIITLGLLFVYFVLPRLIGKKISPVMLIVIAAFTGMLVYGL